MLMLVCCKFFPAREQSQLLQICHKEENVTSLFEGPGIKSNSVIQSYTIILCGPSRFAYCSKQLPHHWCYMLYEICNWRHTLVYLYSISEIILYLPEVFWWHLVLSQTQILSLRRLADVTYQSHRGQRK